MLQENLINDNNDIKSDDNSTMSSNEKEVLSFILMMYILGLKNYNMVTFEENEDIRAFRTHGLNCKL